jgi:hypothetical protein
MWDPLPVPTIAPEYISDTEDLSSVVAGTHGEAEDISGATETIAVGVDSGAAVSVAPTAMCAGYPLVKDDRTGTSYRPVAGPLIKDQGLRTLMVKTDGAAAARTLKFRVCDVHKPLIAVSDMVDNGQWVVFSNKGSFAKCSKTGVITPFVRRKKLFEIDCAVQKPPRSAAAGNSSNGQSNLSSIERQANEMFGVVQEELEEWHRLCRHSQ